MLIKSDFYSIFRILMVTPKVDRYHGLCVFLHCLAQWASSAVPQQQIATCPFHCTRHKIRRVPDSKILQSKPKVPKLWGAKVGHGLWPARCPGQASSGEGAQKVPISPEREGKHNPTQRAAWCSPHCCPSPERIACWLQPCIF